VRALLASGSSADPVTPDSNDAEGNLVWNRFPAFGTTFVFETHALPSRTRFQRGVLRAARDGLPYG